MDIQGKGIEHSASSGSGGLNVEENKGTLETAKATRAVVQEKGTVRQKRFFVYKAMHAECIFINMTSVPLSVRKKFLGKSFSLLKKEERIYLWKKPSGKYFLGKEVERYPQEEKKPVEEARLEFSFRGAKGEPVAYILSFEEGSVSMKKVGGKHDYRSSSSHCLYGVEDLDARKPVLEVIKSGESNIIPYQPERRLIREYRIQSFKEHLFHYRYDRFMSHPLYSEGELWVSNAKAASEPSKKLLVTSYVSKNGVVEEFKIKDRYMESIGLWHQVCEGKLSYVFFKGGGRCVLSAIEQAAK
tara:strand:+ start:3964 stop:4863 length:900 start_codon:yes stop_codon:yes gene_type:complete